jgi:hypothetical protein
LDYLPGLYDPWFLERIQQNYYVLRSGNQDPLFDQNVKLAHVFGSRGIPHVLDVWEGFGPRLAMVVQNGREVFPLRRPHGKNRSALRDGGIVSARHWSITSMREG